MPTVWREILSQCVNCITGILLFAKYTIKLCNFISNTIYSHDHVFIGLSVFTKYKALPAVYNFPNRLSSAFSHD